MSRLMSTALTEPAVRDQSKTDGLTVERLREVLDYDPRTGVFRWTGAPTLTGRRRNNRGRIAGTTAPNGYIKIGVDGVRFQAHRLAWLYVHGKWPIEVDHINGDRGDNRLTNLRASARHENAQNLRAAHVDNAAGLLGVRRHSATRFSAGITVAGRRQHLGSFRTGEEAHRAYLRAKAAVHPFGVLPCPG